MWQVRGVEYTKRAQILYICELIHPRYVGKGVLLNSLLVGTDFSLDEVKAAVQIH